MIDRFTAKAREAIGLAVDAAESLGHNYVGTEHLLIGLLQEGTGVAAKVLEECGVEENKVMELVSQLITPNQPVSLMEQNTYTPSAKRVIENSYREAFVPQIFAGLLIQLRLRVANDQRFPAEHPLQNTVHTKRTCLHGTAGAVDCQIAVEAGLLRHTDMFLPQRPKYNPPIMAQVRYQFKNTFHFLPPHPAGRPISTAG